MYVSHQIGMLKYSLSCIVPRNKRGIWPCYCIYHAQIQQLQTKNLQGDYTMTPNWNQRQCQTKILRCIIRSKKRDSLQYYNSAWGDNIPLSPIDRASRKSHERNNKVKENCIYYMDIIQISKSYHVSSWNKTRNQQ
jgi:hypothetical protein